MINHRSEALAIARTWIDTPWQHHQRLKGVGVDCVQFLLAVAEELGINIELDDNYRRSPTGDDLLCTIGAYFDVKPIEHAEIGDIVVFKFMGVPHHVGIITQAAPTWFIHASMTDKKVCEVPMEAYWKHRAIAGFDLESYWRKN